MKLRNVNIRILGTGINDSYQACVRICDSCGNKIYEGLTYNGYVCVKLKTCRGYCILISGCGFNKREVFYVDTYTQCYTFNPYEIDTPIENNVTFLLTDFNYINLPIMKGEINLWQRQ